MTQRTLCARSDRSRRKHRQRRGGPDREASLGLRGQGLNGSIEVEAFHPVSVQSYRRLSSSPAPDLAAEPQALVA